MKLRTASFVAFGGKRAVGPVATDPTENALRHPVRPRWSFVGDFARRTFTAKERKSLRVFHDTDTGTYYYCLPSEMLFSGTEFDEPGSL